MRLTHSSERHLDAALAEREMQVEHSINVVRMAIIGFGVALDAYSAVRVGLAGPSYFEFVGTIVLGGALYMGFVHFVSRPGAYRPWLKYLTITLDYALLGSYLVEMIQPGFAGRFSMESMAGITAGVALIFVMLSALRMSRAAVVYSTALGSALVLAVSLTVIHTSLSRIWLTPLVVVAGAVTYWTSSSVRTIARDLSRRERLSRFLPRELVKIVESSDIDQTLGGKAMRVTVLFADIRNFTRFSEHREPLEVVAILNEYFTEMSRVIHAHGGMIDKYIGDAVMAVFGAPLPNEADARNAVASAAEMLAALAELNRRWAAEGRAPIEIGIALHTGIAVAGNIGAPDRMDYTVIGDAVNVTARLEELNKHFKTRVLMSEDTYRDMAGHVPTDFVGQSPIRGREEPVNLYTLRVAAPANG